MLNILLGQLAELQWQVHFNLSLTHVHLLNAVLQTHRLLLIKAPLLFFLSSILLSRLRSEQILDAIISTVRGLVDKKRQLVLLSGEGLLFFCEVGCVH